MPAAPARPEEEINDVLKSLAAPEELIAAGVKISVTEFEKDDDSNFHMDFIGSLANLRARSYGIKEIDTLQAKLKAGRITPAIATTTAMVTGFVMLELCKLLHDRPYEAYRNTFANLALPLFQMAEPMPPAKIVSRTEKRVPDPINNPDYVVEEEIVAIPEGFTAWDKIFVDEGDLSLQGFIDFFKNKYQIQLFTVVINGKIIYTMGSRKERLPLPMSQLAQEIGKLDLTGQEFFIPVATFMTAAGDDVEIPDIIFKL
jgi:ubiquitin-activating enzyme E1